jgi:hypothetical protein
MRPHMLLTHSAPSALMRPPTLAGSHVALSQDTRDTPTVRAEHERALGAGREPVDRVQQLLRSQRGWPAVEAAAHQALRLHGAVTSQLALLASLLEAREGLLHDILLQQLQPPSQQPQPARGSGSTMGAPEPAAPPLPHRQPIRPLTAHQLHLISHPSLQREVAGALGAACDALRAQVECAQHARTFFAWVASVAAEDARCAGASGAAAATSGVTPPRMGAHAKPAGHAQGCAPSATLVEDMAALLQQLPGSCRPEAAAVLGTTLQRWLQRGDAAVADPWLQREAREPMLGQLQQAAAQALVRSLQQQRLTGQPELAGLPNDLVHLQQRRSQQHWLRRQAQHYVPDPCASSSDSTALQSGGDRPPGASLTAVAEGSAPAGAAARRLQALALGVARQLSRVRAAAKQQLAAVGAALLPARVSGVG